MNELLVNNQLKPNGITDPGVIQAFAKVNLEIFVPEHLRSVCYTDEAIYVKSDRYILPAFVLAKMLQAADIKSDDRVLDIGFATGYSAAVLLNLSLHYVGVDDDKDFVELAKANIETIEAHCDSLTVGYIDKAPYDVILINGAVSCIPDGLLGQLAQGGRLITIVKHNAFMGVATLFLKENSKISQLPLFDVNVPVLEAFKKPLGFKFF